MEPIFEAVLKGEKDVARVLRAAPQACRTQRTADFLVEAIPHWLYAGDTPLHLAAAALRPGVAGVLLEAGADPKAKNRRGATPLHYACDPSRGPGGDRSSQPAVIELLVAHGAALDDGDRGGATPLHRAVRARSPEAVRRLLALGAKTDVRLRKGGCTPLHLTAQSTGASGTAGTLEMQLEIIDLLRRHGADFRALDGAGRTPHDWARNERVAEALLVRPGPRGRSRP